MIERTHSKLSVGAQCQLLSISRSSFYYAPQGETAVNLDLMLKVDKQFLDTPFYGVRQMTWHLQNEGHPVNEKRIRRLMRLMRLMPIYQKPNTSTPAKGHKTYPYLLGGLRIDRPNQVSLSRMPACAAGQRGRRHHIPAPSRQICFANRLPGNGCGKDFSIWSPSFGRSAVVFNRRKAWTGSPAR